MENAPVNDQSLKPTRMNLERLLFAAHGSKQAAPQLSNTVAVHKILRPRLDLKFTDTSC